jgi:hypothetical protein
LVPEFRRLATFVGGWPEELALEFLLYRQEVSTGEWAELPYWYDLPLWIMKGNEVSGHRIHEATVSEIRWGQFCLFFAVRTEDDLIDGQTPRRLLGLCSHLFLLEGQRVFATIGVEKGEFRNCVAETVRTCFTGIARARVLQRDPSASPELLLETYGDIDSIFSIGAATVCSLGASTLDLPRVTRFVRSMGKVLQTFDDLEDLEEDLTDGRVTFPALVALQSRDRDTGMPLDAKEIRKLLSERDIRSGMCQLLDRCLAEARDAIGCSAPAEMTALLDRTTESVRILHLHGWDPVMRPANRWVMA